MDGLVHDRLSTSEGRGLSHCKGLTEITESLLNQEVSPLTTSRSMFTKHVHTGVLKWLIVPPFAHSSLETVER